MPPIVIDIRQADDARDVVHRAVQALAEGRLVAFPTETVYGIAASALSGEAVQRLVAIKGRAEGHPVSLAIKSADDALDYVPDLNPLAQRLARRCWPGPVTLVVEDSHPDSLLKQLPEAVRAIVLPHRTVGLRVPAHDAILGVLRLLAGPLALTSANRTGEPDSLTAEDVVAALGDDIHMVLDDGRCQFSQPSSVVRVLPDSLKILRAGVVSETTLKRLASYMIVFVCTGNTCRSPMAEVMCRARIAKRLGCAIEELEDRGIVVASAGIAAMSGGRPAQEGVEVMRRRGLDLTGHESQPLSERLVRSADLIYTMTRAHRDAILAQWPDAAARVHALSSDQTDIADPIGGPPELYQQCADEIDRLLEIRVRELDFGNLG